MLKVSEFVNALFQTKKDVKALGFVNLKELTHHHMPMLQFDFFLFERFELVLQTAELYHQKLCGEGLRYFN